jgi:hypothetical protein
MLGLTKVHNHPYSFSSPRIRKSILVYIHLRVCPGELGASLQEVRLYTLPGQTGAWMATSIKCDNATSCQIPEVVDDTFDSACVDGLLSRLHLMQSHHAAPEVRRGRVH